MDKSFEILTIVNPIIPSYNIKQWAFSEHDGCPFKDKLLVDPSEFTLTTSLIYYFDLTYCALKYKEGQPVSFLSFRVYFKINTDGKQIIKRSHYTSITEYNSALSFYKAIAMHSPRLIQYTNCGGKNCIETITPTRKTGKWCTSCSGQIDHPYAFDLLFNEKIYFDTIPKEAIIHIEQTETPIDWNDVTHTLNVQILKHEDDEKVKELIENVCDGGKYDRIIEKMKQQIEEKRKEDLQKLERFQKKFTVDT